MNTRTPLIRAAVATALAAAAATVAFVHTTPTVPAYAAVSMSVDARAPLHATLLPTVSVFAEAGQPDASIAMRIATTAALPVTLMPTVYVNARVADFAASASLANALKARAQTPRAAETGVVVTAAGTLAPAAVVPMQLADAAPALRTRMLPR